MRATYLSGRRSIECCVVQLVRIRLDLLGEVHGGRLGLSKCSVRRKASVAPEYLLESGRVLVYWTVYALAGGESSVGHVGGGGWGGWCWLGRVCVRSSKSS